MPVDAICPLYAVRRVVYKSKGYKRLKKRAESTSMMSSEKYWKKSTASATKPRYFVAAENMAAQSVPEKTIQTIALGTLVLMHAHNGKFVDVKIVDYEKKYNVPEEEVFRCPISALLPVDKKLWKLIEAIPSPVEKVDLLKDKQLCRELLQISVGSVVSVLPLENIRCDSEDIRGVVKYMGPIYKLGSGVYFGLQLLDGFVEGCNNGSIGGQEFFTCPEGRGLFATANHIRPIISAASYHVKNNSAVVKVQKEQHNKSVCKGDNASAAARKSKFNLGDRVVWASKAGISEGTICWRSNLNTFAVVHVNDDSMWRRCKVTLCNDNDIVKVPVSRLMTPDEYYAAIDEKLLAEPIKETHITSMNYDERDSGNSDSGVKIDDLLGLENFENAEKPMSSSSSNGEQQKLEEMPMMRDGEDFVVGSLVELRVNEDTHYGVIRWIGSIVYGSSPTPLIAGVELDEENEAACDGTVKGKKYFDCQARRGYFIPLSQCRKDSRFLDIQHSYTQSDFGCAVIAGAVPPIDMDRSKAYKIHGKYKGIQGHNNSCYLDATLFSMFAFTSVFDCLLFRPPNENDNDNYEQVQRVLREEIVNPLRKNLYVSADRVMKLRKLLDSFTSVRGLTSEEKDPEEFLTSLVSQILKADPFLKLSSGQETYYYQLFVEKDEHLIMPSVQQLFEQSFVSSDIKLKEVPSSLIIQMPRFGKSYKLYPRILPSPLLDVTDVIENSIRQCTVCGELAEFECMDCFKKYPEGLQCVSFCPLCVNTVHNHEERLGHKWSPLMIPEEYRSSMMSKSGCPIPRQYMELFAVVCIETSHYVTFVKCGVEPDASWCFFDSMADRRGGQNGYNIPEVSHCRDIANWLSEQGSKCLRDIDDRNLPVYAKRLLCDAYMCMYQSADVMMYK